MVWRMWHYVWVLESLLERVCSRFEVPLFWLLEVVLVVELAPREVDCRTGLKFTGPNFLSKGMNHFAFWFGDTSNTFLPALPPSGERHSSGCSSGSSCWKNRRDFCIKLGEGSTPYCVDSGMISGVVSITDICASSSFALLLLFCVSLCISSFCLRSRRSNLRAFRIASLKVFTCCPPSLLSFCSVLFPVFLLLFQSLFFCWNLLPDAIVIQTLKRYGIGEVTYFLLLSLSFQICLALSLFLNVELWIFAQFVASFPHDFFWKYF